MKTLIPIIGASAGLLIMFLTMQPKTANAAPSIVSGLINVEGVKTNYDDLFKKYGSLYGINAKILKSMAIQESSLNPNARALTSSALGLMQVTKAAASDVGESWENQTDPETSIRTGAKYLRWLMDNYSFTIDQAIQAYYAGAGTIITGDMGDTFKAPWQSGAYVFAKNIYQPNVLKRANNLTV